MIAKGNLHAHGQKLAAYLVTGKMGERAELVELRGFASSDIREAFIDVMIQAEATRCEKPFFHCYIRLPDNEALTREQWQHVADRIEKQLGFEGQGRAVAFHHDRAAGETHMHMAWSRIDTEEMRAIDPGLYKNKLKEISRQLEKELGLMRLESERDPEQKTQAPARNEFEQSRRLGTDLKAIRETIRACWERSDNGRSFEAALAEHGYILARGDKRDFVVVDHAGGDHALGKRVTGVTAAQTRARLADIDKQQLPSVAQAKQHIVFRQAEREVGAKRVEPRGEPGETRESRLEPAKPPPQLSPALGEIRTAWSLTRTAEELDEALAARGMTIARVTPEEARSSERVEAFARVIGNRSQRLAEGEYVIVNQWGNTYQITQRLTGSDPADLEKRLAGIDPTGLLGVAAAKEAMREASRAAWMEAHRVEQDRLRPKSEPEIKIADALKSTATGYEFAEKIEAAGLTIARVSAADVGAVAALREEEEFARASGVARKARYFGRLEQGDFAVVTGQGDVLRLNSQRLDLVEVEQRLADTQPRMLTVVEARALTEIQREQTAALWEQRRADNTASRIVRDEARDAQREIRSTTQGIERDTRQVIGEAHQAVDTGVRAGKGILGGMATMVGRAFEFLADMVAPPPPPTPEQAERMQRVADEQQQEKAAAAPRVEAVARIRQIAEERSPPVAEQDRYSRYRGVLTRDPEQLRERDQDRGRERER